MEKVYLIGFSNKEPLDDTPQRRICEALLELSGLIEVEDFPNGRRVFTVNNIPDDVPMADIYWEIEDMDIKFEFKPFFELFKGGD